MPDTTLYLFRNDLRLKDNPGLAAARNTEQPLILLFIFDDTDKNRAMGRASRWWLHHSLQALSNDVKKRGGKLFLRKGNTIEILAEIIKQANISKLYFSRTYEPAQRAIEENIYSNWHQQIEIKRFGGYLLFEPEQIRTGNDEAYKVFTPFWKACLKQLEPRIAKQYEIESIKSSDIKIRNNRLNDWNLLPTKPDWAKGFKNNWQPGEMGAKKALKEFLKTGLLNYNEDRNRPDRAGTSRLSPHLHFGEITPARIWHEAKQHSNRYKGYHDGMMCFLRELGWRDFSTHLLFNWSSLPEKPFRKQYDSFPWKKNNNALIDWQKGQTGYPIIDAGMRELWHTGWMPNRVRMIVASFLVKHLLIHWRDGEHWFWDTLVDADLANNAASWQWVAGSGADAAPYFRIFNPILQGKKFDPNGDYVRHWVPEISNLATRYIHEPWLTLDEELNRIKLELGHDYPLPIIEHTLGRQRALEAYKKFKNS